MAAENKPEDDHGNSNGSHVKIFLPKKLLECLPKCSSLPKERHRWNTNEEIAAYLITFEKHEEWLTTSPKTRPQNGSMILYNRKKVKYRKDGYCWKKRKDGKTTREDHMKLKVQGVECLYGCYVHSSIIPTFHRRCYWLLQNPDIVLVHYLNVPAIEDCGKPCGPILCSINTDKKEWAKWTKEELIGQLKPMFHGIKWTCSNGNSSSGFSVEQLVQQILDSHQTKPQPRTHNCLCTGNLGAGSSVHHKCNSAKHRIISPKVEPRSGGYSAHSEVQNNDVSEGKNEHSHGKSSSREKRNGKVAKPVLLHQNSTEVSSTNQVEVPDTTQNSPVSISSGLNSDPDVADSPAVTGVSSMAVASVMGNLSQSATVFMSDVTSEAVYTMSPTTGPNQHLLSSDAAAQGLVLAVSSDGHKFTFPTASSSEGLSMLPASVSEELVLSTTLDSGRKIPETTMNFDPDCFLNNPKQGQTYGGGGPKADCLGPNIRQSPTTERGFNFSAALTKEIKTEDTSFEQQMSKEAFSSSSSSNSLTLTTGSSLLPSGGGLSPSTTLEQMDFSAIDSNKDYSSGFNQAVQSPHVHQTPSPSFFLQDASKPLPLEQNSHNNLNDASSSFVNPLGLPNVKTEASSQSTSNCNGTVEARIESTSSLQLMQFQANFQAMSAEGEVPMETSPQADGNENLLKTGELQACGGTEHYMQPETNGGSLRNGNSLPILQGNMVQGLYPVAHPGLNNSSNMELSLDHFDISFSNQFSDLINDFISVEGGSNTIYGHQLVSGESSGLSQPEDANRASYSQAEMCIPCCSPQQASLHLSSSTENGASTLAYMHVTEVVSAAAAAAAAQGTLGMLQQSGRLFMVTDYSPEWSYPEGGVKVLITGPWQEASNNYSCLFDQISVPASLIQPGVLRCYCPAHDTGLVTLQVAFNNQIISNSVVFEYKARALPPLPSSQHDWLSLDENQFRMSILERLEQMERRMAEMTGSQQQQHKQGVGGGGGNGSGNGGSQAQCVSGAATLGNCFESRVVVVCEKMMSRACWAKSKHLIHSKTFRGMTLLHLAAAQGYATLIQTLLKWRTKHADSIDLELEVDPLNVDHFSCTPLMWACALGHMDAAVVLYKWDRRAISIPDSLGRLPLAIARSRGHVKLAECLEHLQREEQAQLRQTPRIPCPSHEEPSSENWIAQWHSEMVASQEPQKGVTVISNSNTELRRPRSEPSSYYSSESQKEYPAPKKHKLNPDYFSARQEKLLSTALSLEQPSARKPSSSAKQSLPETISPRHGVRDYTRELVSEVAGYHGSGTQAGAKWSPKEAYIGVPAMQVAGSPKGLALGKDSGAQRLHPREQMSVLMMAEREAADAELLSFRDGTESEDCLHHMDDLQVTMMTLAEHIIEATPERIKRENFVPMEAPPAERTESATISTSMSWLASYLADVDHLPSAAQIRSLYIGPLTPSSNTSLSPASSPVNEMAFEKPSLPSATDWTEFLSASTSEKVENEFAQLTLSDHEQRELYEAAKLVQTVFRKYKGRPLREQQEVAAAVIQRCYRKYKQLTWIALKYALYKKMIQAAILIQSKFRSYYEQKKFQQSRRAAVLIQQFYRSYKECGKRRQSRRTAALVQQKLRSSLLTKKQDQAARKIMRFLRRCRHRAKELKKAKELEERGGGGSIP
ncbi:calmodulin-binding transcription activator 1 isoform X2 [Podarcis raffonei]|uniref:calmodulin-binding transcription activator 1 isoform X2 n=2 Tax=Podarcis raffonei TaxID=65483 RepID=UPI002329618C|nr:calmodulin-binding transcription activator 1 isoform X2 [Podarcis raffonei]